MQNMQPFSQHRAGSATWGALVLFIMASCSSTESPRTPFSFSIDASLAPAVAAIEGADDDRRPLSTFVDAAGIQTDFVEDELVVRGASDDDLARLVATYDAAVGADSWDIPELQAAPRLVALRVKKKLDSLDAFASEVRSLGGEGAYRFASLEGARLVATAAHEASRGLHVAPNFVHTSAAHTWRRRTTEGNKSNAFAVPQFQGAYGGEVIGAWQYMEWMGYTKASVPVAIVDGGFYVGPDGHPIDSTIGTDLPFNVEQRTFSVWTKAKDRVGTANRSSCTNGTPCPWHGNGSAGVATGGFDDGKGMAGTGGQVASPVLLDMAGDDITVMEAIGYAGARGARVINLSFGGACNGICRFGRELDGYEAMVMSVAAQHALIASAGNDNENVDDVHTYPCVLPGVICVGAAMEDGMAAGYSNHGTGVTLFAPTNIPVMPDGQSQAPVHTGTSAAAPFVAGVVAMMVARKPNITPAEVKTILTSTATPVSGDAKIATSAGRLNARAAVVVAGGLPADAFEPNDAQAVTIPKTGATDLTLATGSDKDFYHFTVGDFGYVGIEVVNAHEGFGYLAAVLEAESGIVGSGDAWTSALTADGTYLEASLTPGTYRIRMSGLTQPYDLKLTVGEMGLSADAFEVNDSLAAATTLASTNGLRRANIHLDSDVDYFQIPTGAIANNENVFWSITWAEMPITLDLFDQNGTQIDTRTGANPYFVFDSAKAQKTFYVRVSGPRGRYGFDYTRYKKPPAIPPQVVKAQVPWLDTGDPGAWNGFVNEVDTWIGFTAGPSAIGLPSPKTVVFKTSSALHADLVDVSGRTVVGGAPTGNGSETLDLASTASGSDYFIHVTRAGASAVGATLPSLAYSAEFTR
jgi:hypothetical protein